MFGRTMAGKVLYGEMLTTLEPIILHHDQIMLEQTELVLILIVVRKPLHYNQQEDNVEVVDITGTGMVSTSVTQQAH
mgnify:CR=1 FL=1